MSTENQWLEDVFPLKKSTFLGEHVVFFFLVGVV